MLCIPTDHERENERALETAQLRGVRAVWEVRSPGTGNILLNQKRLVFQLLSLLEEYLPVSPGQDGGGPVQAVHRPPGPGLGGRQAGDRGLELRERGRGRLLHPQHILQRGGSGLRNMHGIQSLVMFCVVRKYIQ